MNKPVIGITLDEGNNPSYSVFPWYAARKNYADPISKLNGIPIFLSHDLKNLRDYLSLIDGLIITGGDFDINPSFYGENIKSKTVSLKEERTNFEFKILEEALKKNIPTLCICGGHQLLNVVLGGSLYQDISEEFVTEIDHEQKLPRDLGSHTVEIKEKTKLRNIVSKNQMFVNSAHHQSIKIVGRDLMVNAVCNDGIIEGIEHKNLDFCIGVQWHPEFLIDKGDTDIFFEFIKRSSMPK